jgi:hypothetical protein
MAEGIACYKLFLSGLLDITDNVVKGAVVPPPNVVRHDEDDPYLVVAADKGTATFSDIANGVSADYGFWLGDAFASGGSVGTTTRRWASPRAAPGNRSSAISARWASTPRRHRLHRGRHWRHVGRRVWQRHAAVASRSAGRGV